VSCVWNWFGEEVGVAVCCLFCSNVRDGLFRVNPSSSASKSKDPVDGTTDWGGGAT